MKLAALIDHYSRKSYPRAIYLFHVNAINQDYSSGTTLLKDKELRDYGVYFTTLIYGVTLSKILNSYVYLHAPYIKF